MGLGTGIFLSVLVASAVFLFLGTRDRWNWRRIVFVTCGGFLVLVAIGAFLAYYLTRPTPAVVELHTEFLGVPIGATKQDVLFLKGSPSDTLHDDTRWDYDDDALSVVFTDGGVSKLLTIRDARLAGVGRRTPVSELVERFGDPPSESRRSDGRARVYAYPEHGLMFILAEGVVQALGIFDPQVGPWEFGEALAVEEASEGAAEMQDDPALAVDPDATPAAVADPVPPPPAPLPPESQLWGVQLGDSKEDVLFKKGVHSGLEGTEVWIYQEGRARISVRFLGEAVAQIVLSFPNGPEAHVAGVHGDYTSEAVVTLLGEPAETRPADEGRVRWFFYPGRNAVFGLERNEVFALGVYDAARVTPDNFWR